MSTEIEASPDFEETLRRLETIVAELERGDPGLSKALTSYEEGVRLLARCQTVLERAERSVALLTGVDASGAAVTAPFDASATAGETPAPAPVKTRKKPKADPSEGFIPF